MKLYLEKPSIKRKEEALDYINEFYQYNSNINGTGGLQRYLDNYEEWLERLEKMRNKEYARSINRCYGDTFFLIRKNDNRILGMINIRLELNDILRKTGGHIGYSIRPTERRKGYNKINLYLGLKYCQEKGLDKVMLTCSHDNLGSDKTIKLLGGKLERQVVDPEDGKLTNVYWINVDESIDDNKDKYKKYIL